MEPSRPKYVKGDLPNQKRSWKDFLLVRYVDALGNKVTRPGSLGLLIVALVASGAIGADSKGYTCSTANGLRQVFLLETQGTVARLKLRVMIDDPKQLKVDLKALTANEDLVKLLAPLDCSLPFPQSRIDNPQIIKAIQKQIATDVPGS